MRGQNENVDIFYIYILYAGERERAGFGDHHRQGCLGKVRTSHQQSGVGRVYKCGAAGVGRSVTINSEFSFACYVFVWFLR